jgi:hypothetical protein
VVEQERLRYRVAVGGSAAQDRRHGEDWPRVERKPTGHCGPVGTQRLCMCRSTRMIRGCGCGFVQRARGEPGEETVERRKAVRGRIPKLKGPSTEVSKLRLRMGRGSASSMDSIAVIGEKIRQSSCKPVNCSDVGLALVTSVLLVFFRPWPNDQSLRSAPGLLLLTVHPSYHPVS